MDNNLSNVLLSNNVASYSKQWMLPKWTIIWLIISLVIISWDVMFVLLRPASFAHGSLGYLWIPYIKYVQIDTSYADLNNPFVTAQALMSLMENAIGIMGLYYYFFKKIKTACLLIFSSQLLTCTKTILIFLLEI
ncbi:MAG: hypothetical protein JO131_00415, partial [Gammaproteobacteria bacterium]|nr:hypothetical protein [Gammaproteobacteria bacterium]